MSLLQEVLPIILFLVLVGAEPIPLWASASKVAGAAEHCEEYASVGVPWCAELEITFQIDDTAGSKLQFPLAADPPSDLKAGTGIPVTSHLTPDIWKRSVKTCLLPNVRRTSEETIPGDLEPPGCGSCDVAKPS